MCHEPMPKMPIPPEERSKVNNLDLAKPENPACDLETLDVDGPRDPMPKSAPSD